MDSEYQQPTRMGIGLGLAAVPLNLGLVSSRVGGMWHGASTRSSSMLWAGTISHAPKRHQHLTRMGIGVQYSDGLNPSEAILPVSPQPCWWEGADLSKRGTRAMQREGPLT